MKKFLALILALTMVMGMATMAMAAEVTGDATFEKGAESGETEWADTNTSKNDVVVTVNGSDGTQAATTPVYKVVVKWESLNFTYEFNNAEASEVVWNPDTHTYVNSQGEELTGNWVDPEAEITVINHSNASVTAKASIDTDSKSGVDVTVDTAVKTLVTAVDTLVDAAPSATITVQVSGKPNDVAGFTIGTVTVSISAA